jgi:hypothetical protein
MREPNCGPDKEIKISSKEIKFSKNENLKYFFLLRGISPSIISLSPKELMNFSRLRREKNINAAIPGSTNNKRYKNIGLRKYMFLYGIFIK